MSWPHALDFLSGLDGACFVQQRSGIDNLPAEFLERLKIRHHESGRLAYHAVGGLRAHVEFDGNFVREATPLQHFICPVPGAKLRWARVSLIIASEVANILRPRVSFDICLLRFKGN